MIGVASLRCGDPTRVRAIAAGGGPTREGDDLHVFCPLCSCLMSGDAHIPNGRYDGCEDGTCPCHREDLP